MDNLFLIKSNPIKYFFLLLIFGLIPSPNLIQAQTSITNNSNPIPHPPPQGISAWVYDQNQHWVDLINSYNTTVSSQPGGNQRKFQFLFPNGGGIEITSGKYKRPYARPGCNFYYYPKVSQFYATRLPDIHLLPTIGSGDGALLATWSPDDQQKLAQDVAKAINDDPNAAGVQIDIEPFNAAKLLPFFVKLRPLLNSKGKFLSVFGWDSSGKLFDNTDILVTSGYDFGIKSITLDQYQYHMKDQIIVALRCAQKSGTYIMVGVPAGASYEEYSFETGAHTSKTGYTQEQWFQTAMNVLSPHQFDDHYLGISLWGLNQINKEKLQNKNLSFKQPVEMPETNWEILENIKSPAFRTPISNSIQ